jgi:hypothetical protein
MNIFKSASFFLAFLVVSWSSVLAGDSRGRYGGSIYEIQPVPIDAAHPVKIEIKNDYGRDLDMTGWQIKDVNGNTFTFPNTLPAIPPDAFVVVEFGGTPANPPPQDDSDFTDDKMARIHCFEPWAATAFRGVDNECALFAPPDQPGDPMVLQDFIAWIPKASVTAEELAARPPTSSYALAVAEEWERLIMPTQLDEVVNPATPWRQLQPGGSLAKIIMPKNDNDYFRIFSNPGVDGFGKDTVLPAPIPLMPAEHAQIQTRAASKRVAFSWIGWPMFMPGPVRSHYRLQVSKNNTFTDVVIDEIMGEDSGRYLMKADDSPNRFHIDEADKVLGKENYAGGERCTRMSDSAFPVRLLPGKYFWRVRSEDYSVYPWSATTEFDVIHNPDYNKNAWTLPQAGHNILGGTLSSLLITEIQPVPLDNDKPVQIELYNNDTQAIDVSGWQLKNMSGVPYTLPTLPPMPSKAFIVIAFGGTPGDPLPPDDLSFEGDNLVRIHCFAAGAAAMFRSRHNECALYSPVQEGIPGVLKDYVYWNPFGGTPATLNNDVMPAQASYPKALELGLWKDGEFLGVGDDRYEERVAAQEIGPFYLFYLLPGGSYARRDFGRRMTITGEWAKKEPEDTNFGLENCWDPPRILSPDGSGNSKNVVWIYSQTDAEKVRFAFSGCRDTGGVFRLQISNAKDFQALLADDVLDVEAEHEEENPLTLNAPNGSISLSKELNAGALGQEDPSIYYFRVREESAAHQGKWNTGVVAIKRVLKIENGPAAPPNAQPPPPPPPPVFPADLGLEFDDDFD